MTAIHPTARDARGRFQPGQSGNPAGKAPGTLNHATRLRQTLEGDDFDAAARRIIERARAGDFRAARFLVDRLDPKPRDRPIELDIPDDATPAERLAAVSRAMCRGEITPQEALTIGQVFMREDARREATPALHSAYKSSTRVEPAAVPPPVPAPSPHLHSPSIWPRRPSQRPAVKPAAHLHCTSISPPPARQAA